MKWALYDAPMLRTPAGKPDVAARFVLVAHAERADKKGRGSYPGPAALIEATGYDERTIDRAERRLRDAGLLIHKGTSHLGTTRWDLDLTKRRDDDQQAAAEARVARRKAQDAARQRSRRERLKAAGEAAEMTNPIEGGQYEPTNVTDAESVTDPADDAQAIDDDACTVGPVTDAAPPKPPMNHP